MRPKLSKALRKAFKDRLAGWLPLFKKVDFDDPGGSVMFFQRVNARLFLYLLLEISAKRDEFAVMAAWSTVEGKLEHMTDDPDPTKSHWFWRLRGPPKGGRSPNTNDWWQLEPTQSLLGLSPEEMQRVIVDSVVNRPKEEDLMYKIEPMVGEAMERIEQQAVPIFERVQARRKR